MNQNQTGILRAALVGLIAFWVAGLPAVAQEKDNVREQERVFSGPQIGESLVAFPMKVAFGGGDDQGNWDIIKQAKSGPVVIVFVHKRSRPAFALANAIVKYCNEAGKDRSPQSEVKGVVKGVVKTVCFLTDDATETSAWLGKVKRYFAPKTPVGYSTEGVSGPGAYGLNRNVELTVLVGNEGKVTANFALVQPGAHADGPAILKAIAATLGIEKQPDINRYLPSNQAAQDAPIAIDPMLMKHLRSMNRQGATEADVAAGLAAIEKMIDGNEALQNQLGTVLARWNANQRLAQIGNQQQQAKLARWSQAYRPKRNMNRLRRQPPQRDAKLTGMLRQMIQKSNSDQEVDSFAKAIEDYIRDKPAATAELRRITTAVTKRGVETYGTPHAQNQLKDWAKKLSSESTPPEPGSHAEPNDAAKPQNKSANKDVRRDRNQTDSPDKT